MYLNPRSISFPSSRRTQLIRSAMKRDEIRNDLFSFHIQINSFFVTSKIITISVYHDFDNDGNVKYINGAWWNVSIYINV